MIYFDPNKKMCIIYLDVLWSELYDVSAKFVHRLLLLIMQCAQCMSVQHVARCHMYFSVT